METIRKPFQGVKNIVRFNWHFYVIAGMLTILLLAISFYAEQPYALFLQIGSLVIFTPIFISLIVSYYVYDKSDLYNLGWIKDLSGKTINIHSGFDETSAVLQAKFPKLQLSVFDFYDPDKNTEISLQRARKAYPPFPGTLKITIRAIPEPNNAIDTAIVIFSAHEIRKEDERDTFFKEIVRVIKPGGTVMVTEHLRDFPNFLAYTVGFFHFMPRASWLRTFQKNKLEIIDMIKTTPFVTTFILRKNGNSD